MHRMTQYAQAKTRKCLSPVIFLNNQNVVRFHTKWRLLFIYPAGTCKSVYHVTQFAKTSGFSGKQN